LNVFVVTDQTLATTLGDREGVLASKIEELLPGVVRRFDVVAVQATTDTHPWILSQLQEGGVVLATAVPDIDQIGRHRRETLRMALAHGSSSRIVYMDFDYLLRWIENDASELDRLLEATAESDCAVIGRGPRSLAAVPERLAFDSGAVASISVAEDKARRRIEVASVAGSSAERLGNNSQRRRASARHGRLAYNSRAGNRSDEHDLYTDYAT
jgi:hypothetical protein